MSKVKFNLMPSSLIQLKRPLQVLRSWLPPINFITIHYGYFILAGLIGSFIIWVSATPHRSLAYTDALFLSVSAMVCLMLQIHVGSAIFVSAFTVQFRRRVFEQKFKHFIEQERKHEQERRERSLSRGRKRTFSFRDQSRDPVQELYTLAEWKEHHKNWPSLEEQGTAALEQSDSAKASSSRATEQSISEEVRSESISSPRFSPPHSSVHFSDDKVFGHGRRSISPVSTARVHRHGLFNAQGVGARSSASLQPTSLSRADDHKMESIPEAPAGRNNETRTHLQIMGGWVSRNSEFHGLSDKERERLGGYEYRAMNLLSWLVPAYFYLWQLLGCLACGAWIASNRPETTLANGLNSWWVGVFNAVSAFNNSGMSLLDANMTPFKDGYYLLLTMGLLILAGNTCYPIFLRLIVWSMLQHAKLCINLFGDDSGSWTERVNTIRFLLDHPRRCYTNLFPAPHTWWLLLVVVTLNGTDWVAFEILNIGNSNMDNYSPAERAIDGWFQALAVRSGGFYVVAISSVRIGLQVLYVVMMYISVYPVVITMRNSNVYEERSLGIYVEDQRSYNVDEAARNGSGFLRRLTHGILPGGPEAKQSNGVFLRQQIRAQLAHDAWTVVLALFFIMIIETGQFDANATTFSVFNFIFEIVSAYGCVGLSIGLPNQAYSFCGSWHTLSKLILCAVMLRGRHRGLPVAIDRAVLLPGEEMEQAEEEDGRIRFIRTMSRERRGANEDA